jgi:hypothetical protein
VKIKDIIVESTLTEAPAGGYRLVRVVDGLDNIQANGDGSLTAIARFNGHSQRNTLHFTVNSMVGDHNMGKFPGKYVIIANPAEMPRDQAAGARAEDTWYRFNNEGEINLGRAIVLAPEGSSVPNGIKAQYYKGDRGTAIDTAFKQMNVGFHGVAGTNSVIGIQNDEYYKDFSTQHGTGATQGGQHDGSLEGYLESIPARLQGYLGHLQKSIYYEPPGERETFVTSYANGIIDNFRDDINKWATANPQEFKVSATYFNYIIQVMDAYQAIFTQAQQAYNQQYQDYLTAEKQWKASNQPRPGEPPPLDPAPHPQMATWPPPGLNLQIPKIQLSYAKKNLQGMTEGVYRGDWVRHPDNPWQIGQIQSIDNGQAAVIWKKTDKRKKAMSSTHAVDALQHARREFSQLTQPTHTPGVAEGFSLGNMLPWPEVVNKINSAMRAMGWKGQRKDDGSFIFTTRGAMTDEYYIVIIDNEGDSMFTYALGTVEEGDPHIGEQDTLPTTEASVSELMNAVRDGFGLNENFADGKNPGRKGLAKRSGVNTKASVSSLRKTAKNSSGEKQRMAHWLANMKAGRAKARKK